MRFIILSVFLLTLLLGLAMVFGGPISQLGVWDWRMAFTIMQKGAPALMIGGGLSLIGLVIGIVGKYRGTVLPGLLAIIVTAGVLFSLGNMRSNAGAHPIHDLTTDFDAPPQIIAGASADRLNPPEYVGAKDAGKDGLTVGEAQREIYPDIAPQIFSQKPETVFAAAVATATANAMGWEILASDLASGKAQGTVEAVHKSLWFGFKDDIIIRIRPEGTGARVDIRSKSRVGGSDLGANAKRIRDYQAKLTVALSRE